MTYKILGAGAAMLLTGTLGQILDPTQNTPTALVVQIVVATTLLGCIVGAAATRS